MKNQLLPDCLNFLSVKAVALRWSYFFLQKSDSRPAVHFLVIKQFALWRSFCFEQISNFLPGVPFSFEWRRKFLPGGLSFLSIKAISVCAHTFPPFQGVKGGRWNVLACVPKLSLLFVLPSLVFFVFCYFVQIFKVRCWFIKFPLSPLSHSWYTYNPTPVNFVG